MQETLKSVVARYNAEQLLTMREKVVHSLAMCLRLTAGSRALCDQRTRFSHTSHVTRHTSPTHAHQSHVTQVSEQIKDHLTAKAVEMYISIDDIAITHLAFDEEFTTAIERKQVAQQDVERVKVRVK